MAIFKLFSLILYLLTIIKWVHTQHLYPQIDEIVSLKGGQNYFSNNHYGGGINLQDHFLNEKTRSHTGNDHGEYLRNVPLYAEKKVTTIRKLPSKKQSSKPYNNVPSVQKGQLSRGKSQNLYSVNRGYNNKLSPNRKGRNNQVGSQTNWFKGGNNIKKNVQQVDIAKTVNDFNKQIEHINFKAFNENFKYEPAPQVNTHHNFNNIHSFNEKNKHPFDYIPVNLDAKINTDHSFNFNSDIKFHNHGLNNLGSKINPENLFNSNSELKINNHGTKTIDLSTDKLKQNTNFNSGWNYKPEPIKAQPVRYETFVPGINVFGSHSGKLNQHNMHNLENFHNHGKGEYPSSFVQVTNGKVSYNYHIQHLPVHH